MSTQRLRVVYKTINSCKHYITLHQISIENLTSCKPHKNNCRRNNMSSRQLVAGCRTDGMKNIIFMSSITTSCITLVMFLNVNSSCIPTILICRHKILPCRFDYLLCLTYMSCCKVMLCLHEFIVL